MKKGIRNLVIFSITAIMAVSVLGWTKKKSIFKPAKDIKTSQTKKLTLGTNNE